MLTAIRSLRLAARRLGHARGFTLAAILTLALGLGATTTVFSVVYGVLLRPLPYAAPDRLVSLSHTLVVGGVLSVDQTDASILFYRRHNRAFVHLGGYQIAAAGVASTSGTDAERVPAGRVTAGVFRALQVSPLLGRVFERVRRSTRRSARRGHRRTAVDAQVRRGSRTAESPDPDRWRAPRGHRHHAGRRSFSVAGYRPLAADAPGPGEDGLGHLRLPGGRALARRRLRGRGGRRSTGAPSAAAGRVPGPIDAARDRADAHARVGASARRRGRRGHRSGVVGGVRRRRLRAGHRVRQRRETCFSCGPKAAGTRSPFSAHSAPVPGSFSWSFSRRDFSSRPRAADSAC